MSSWGLFASGTDNTDAQWDVADDQDGAFGEDGVVTFEELLAQAEAEPPLERLPLLAAALLKHPLTSVSEETSGSEEAEPPPTTTAEILVCLRHYSPLDLLESSHFPALLKGVLLYHHEAEEGALRLLSSVHHAAVLNETPMPAAITTATVLSIATGILPPELRAADTGTSVRLPQITSLWLAFSNHCIGSLLSRSAMHIISGSPCWQFILLATLSKLVFMAEERKDAAISFDFLSVLLLKGMFRRQTIRYLRQGGYLQHLLSLTAATTSTGAAGVDTSPVRTLLRLLENTADGRGALAHAREGLLSASSAAVADSRLQPATFRCVKPIGNAAFYDTLYDSASAGAGKQEAAGGPSSLLMPTKDTKEGCSCACCVSQEDAWLWSLERVAEKKSEAMEEKKDADYGDADADAEEGGLPFVSLFATEPTAIDGFA
jgi:hypothetical protein